MCVVVVMVHQESGVTPYGVVLPDPGAPWMHSCSLFLVALTNTRVSFLVFGIVIIKRIAKRIEIAFTRASILTRFGSSSIKQHVNKTASIISPDYMIVCVCLVTHTPSILSSNVQKRNSKHKIKMHALTIIVT